LSALRLQVDYPGNARPTKEMMASGDAHLKSKSLKEAAEVAEIPTGVAIWFSEALDQLCKIAHDMVGRDALSPRFIWLPYALSS